MKFWSKCLMVALTVVAMAGCREDSPEAPVYTPEDLYGDVYAKINLQLPATPGTRSNTNPGGGSSDGTEEGKDFENKVQNLLLVLAERNNAYIAHAMTGNLTTKSGTLESVASIERTNLYTYYDKNKQEANSADGMSLTDDARNIRLFAFCNPPQDLLDELDKIQVEESNTDWINAACKVGEKTSVNRDEGDRQEGAVDGTNQIIWGKNSFLMSNAELYVSQLPATFDEWLREYSEISKPFDFCRKEGQQIDPIPVERSVARFDFRDGSPAGNPSCTYNISTTGQNNGALQVKLVSMSLVNMSNSFYYLRRVSEANDGYSNPLLCGLETASNWVVDTDAEKDHKQGVVDAAALSGYFNFCLFNKSGIIDQNARDYWNNYNIQEVLGESDKGTYSIWRYVTENTVPGINNQKNGVSTGIVFKGKLLAPENPDTDMNEDLRKAINGEYKAKPDPNDPNKYLGYVYEITERNGDAAVTKTYPMLILFNDILYVGWNNQIRPVVEDPSQEGTPIYTAANKEYQGKTVDAWYQDVVAAFNDKDNAALSTALTGFRAAATSAGFTIYQASNDADDYRANDKGKADGAGYYFYYYYWNRHNDNLYPGSMQRMEFGVVRNNVYKLAVTDIRRLGHPRFGGNDPEPPTPDTPDESDKVYLKVSVEVRPWTVRINNIEF